MSKVWSIKLELLISKVERSVDNSAILTAPRPKGVPVYTSLVVHKGRLVFLTYKKIVGDDLFVM